MDNEDIRSEAQISARFTISFDFEERIVEVKAIKKIRAKQKVDNNPVKT